MCPSLPLITVKKDVSSGPTANGDGTWTITYNLTATNVGAADGTYTIGDELQFGTGIQITSANVTTVPAGVTAAADWNGQGKNTIATNVPLAAGGVHTYQVTAVVSLDLSTVTPASLGCPAPGEAGGLANTVTLNENGEDRTDDACAPLPLIDVSKSLAGPVTPVAGQDGTYDATYEITVSNRGPGAGSYDLDDAMTIGKGITVVGVQSATTDAPNSVGINPGFGSNGDTHVVTGQPIAAAPAGSSTAHHYTVVLRYSVDPSLLDIPVGATCPDSGLNNTANVTWNGYHADDDACFVPGKPVIDKKLVSADPIGDGKWKVVYDLTVSNTGTEATTYTVDDKLLFDPSVKAEKVTATGPAGVTIDDTFDGAAHQRIATKIGIGGLDDAGYAPHVYTVTVIADVPLHLDKGDADGNGAPGCTLPAGNNTLKQGFNNQTTLTDETGGMQTDTDCAGVPSWDITKTMDGAPTLGKDGWTVNYVLTVVNDGAAAGKYDLTDRLRYGKGIEVTSAKVTSAPDGVTPAGTWTGQGAKGARENVITTGVALDAGSTHTYRVRVLAKLNTATADSSAITCPAEGSDGAGGFANTAGVDHNGLTDTASACATPKWPAGVADPLASTGSSIAWGIPLGALVLLILGGGAIWFSKRRKHAAGTESNGDLS